MSAAQRTLLSSACRRSSRLLLLLALTASLPGNVGAGQAATPDAAQTDKPSNLRPGSANWFTHPWSALLGKSPPPPQPKGPRTDSDVSAGALSRPRLRLPRTAGQGSTSTGGALDRDAIATASLREGHTRGFTLFLPVLAGGDGQVVKLTLAGASADTFSVLDRGNRVDLSADGSFRLTIPAGERQVTVALWARDDFDSDDTLTLRAQLADADGTPTHREHGELTLTLDAEDETEPDDPAAIMRTLLGDLAPVDFDPDRTDVQIRYDDLGNVITDPGVVEVGRRDVVYDSGAADRIATGGGDDKVYRKRGGDDVVDLGEGNDDLWTLGDPSGYVHAFGGAGRDYLDGDHLWIVGGAGGVIKQVRFADGTKLTTDDLLGRLADAAVTSDGGGGSVCLGGTGDDILRAPLACACADHASLTDEDDRGWGVNADTLWHVCRDDQPAKGAPRLTAPRCSARQTDASHSGCRIHHDRRSVARNATSWRQAA